jgi:hypothetical protein
MRGHAGHREAACVQAWPGLLGAFCLAGAGIGLEETAEPTLVAQALPNQLRGSWRRLSPHGAVGSSS